MVNTLKLSSRGIKWRWPQCQDHGETPSDVILSLALKNVFWPKTPRSPDPGTDNSCRCCTTLGQAQHYLNLNSNTNSEYFIYIRQDTIEMVKLRCINAPAYPLTSATSSKVHLSPTSEIFSEPYKRGISICSNISWMTNHETKSQMNTYGMKICDVHNTISQWYDK